MNPTYIAVVGTTIVFNAFAAIADLLRAGFVAKTAGEVGVARSWLPLLGALKGAAVIGLLLGILGVPIIGTAAAAGLVVFFIGALTAHVRARVFYNIAFPGFFFALAVASLILSIRR
jgi:DoxX-like family